MGRRPLTPDSPVVKIGGGTAVGATLITAGTTAVEAFGVGSGVVSAGTTLLAGAETAAAVLPIVGTTASSAVAAIGSGAAALGAALAPVAVIAAPIAIGGAIGCTIGMGICKIFDL